MPPRISKHRLSKLILTYIRWLLPVLFICYYGGIISFTHVHVVNGVTIVHAHPYKGQDAAGGHQHSLHELQLYHQLSVVSQEDDAIQPLGIPPFYPLFVCWLDVEMQADATQADVFSFYLRAPPSPVHA